MLLESGYLVVAFFILFALCVTPLLLSLGFLLRPKHKPTGLGGAAYECGERPLGPARTKINFRFYVMALVFLLFEIEIAAVLPVATILKVAVDGGQGWVVFAEIFLFVGLMTLGLVYCWRRGDLDWVKSLGNTT